MCNKIYFYGSRDPYFELSNFYIASMEIDGLSWLSVEHYYQASKFQSEVHCERIRLSETPSDARQLGNSREFSLHENWENEKEDHMLKALRKKFSANSLREIILSTETAMLVERSPHDNYWGCGKTGNGRNRLGVLLMQVRDEIA